MLRTVFVLLNFGVIFGGGGGVGVCVCVCVCLLRNLLFQDQCSIGKKLVNDPRQFKPNFD